MIEYAQWTAIFVASINLFLSLIDKQLLKLFRNKDATSLAKGINIDSLSPLYRWRLRRIRNMGFILNSEKNTYYFNEDVYWTKRKTRRIRVIVLAAFAILIVLSIVYLNR